MEKDHKCCVSTAIDEITFTFGSGGLDDYGFWEFPCIECANRHKEKFPEDSVWPT